MSMSTKTLLAQCWCKH